MMCQHEGISEMKELLDALNQSEENEALLILKNLGEYLRKDIKMKDYFHEENGIMIVLHCAMNASLTVLNKVFEVFSTAIEEHDKNRTKLIRKETYMLINKVLNSSANLGFMHCVRPLLLISCLCAESVTGQNLANASGCVNEMERLFLKFSQELSHFTEVREEEIFFNVLCTAIASVCGDPANQKNQKCLQSVVYEAAKFLREWVQMTKEKFQEISKSCIRNLLIMLPHILRNNKENQDYFARGGGVNTIIKALHDMESQEHLDGDWEELQIKFVYVLSVSLLENTQIIEVAGILGAIPILIQLLKKVNTKDKGVILLCLVNLLHCPQNEQIFLHSDILTCLSSEMAIVGEDSECWKVIEKMYNHLKEKQKSRERKVSSPSSNSFVGQKNICTDHDGDESRVTNTESEMFNKSPCVLTRKNNQEKEDDTIIRNETRFKNERYFGNSPRPMYQQKIYPKQSEDYFSEHSRSRNQSETSEIIPIYYKRQNNITRDERMPYDKYKTWQWERTKMHYEKSNHRVYRYQEHGESVLSQHHKLYLPSPREHNYHYGHQRNEVFLQHNDDTQLPKLENPYSTIYLQNKNSSSELINKARRLYPRNKMRELEEIDIHQKRHYLTKREDSDHEDDDGGQLKELARRKRQESIDSELDLNDDNSKMVVKRNSGDCFGLDVLQKNRQKCDLDRYGKHYYTPSEERKDLGLELVGRQARTEKERNIPKKSFEKFSESDEEYNLDPKYNPKFARQFSRDDLKVVNEPSNHFYSRSERYSQYYRKGEYIREMPNSSPRRGFSSHFIDRDRREWSHMSTEKRAKDDNSAVNKGWKYEMQGSKSTKLFQGHRRSKSVGRLVDLDIQNMFQGMEVTREENRNKYISDNQTEKRNYEDFNHEQMSPENIRKPKLIGIREAYQKHVPGKLWDKNYKEESDRQKDTKINSEAHHYAASGEANFSDQRNVDVKESNFQNEAQQSKQLIKPELIFSEEEEKNLIQGIQKFGLDFKTIFQEFQFNKKRTPHDLYEKWKTSFNLS